MNIALLVWGQFSFVLGVSGNVFVLYATIIYGAIKLDKMSTWIIKNLAVVDTVSCIFIIVPAISNQYLEGQWAFGLRLCYVHAVCLYSSGVANMVLINLLSINKLTRCIFPLWNRSPTKHQLLFVPISSVLASTLPIIWTAIGLSNGILGLLENDTEIPAKACRAFPQKTVDNNSGTVAGFFVSLFCVGVPCLSLVLTTTILLVYAIRKTNRPINKRNVAVVIAVTIIFLISFVPYLLYAAARLRSDVFKKQHLDIIFECAWSFAFISTWSNPIIYWMTNRSFRNFANSKICCKKSTPDTSNSIQMTISG